MRFLSVICCHHLSPLDGAWRSVVGLPSLPLRRLDPGPATRRSDATYRQAPHCKESPAAPRFRAVWRSRLCRVGLRSGGIMRADLNLAEQWAWAIAGGERLTVQVFDDAKRGARAEIRGGALCELWPWIEARQADGCGVFGTVNATPDGYRQAADVTHVRALFVDFDGKEPDRPWHLEPTMIVQSGRGIHAYWSLDPWPVANAAEFKDAQKRLAKHYGSDPAVCDLPRVMRLAGTWHQKGVPFLVHLPQVSGAVYHPSEVLAGIATLPVERPRARVDLRTVGGEVDLATLDIVALCRDAGLNPRMAGVGDKGDPQWAIDCPWRSEHTGGAQGATSTMVWERGGGWPAFTCKHAHCFDRRLYDLLGRLGVSVVARHTGVKPSRRAEMASDRLAVAERGLPWN